MDQTIFAGNITTSQFAEIDYFFVTCDKAAAPVKLERIMAASIARHTRYIDQSQSSIVAPCKIRANLLDRLAGILVSLGRAKLELTSAEQNGDIGAYEFAQLEVERLRDDCGSIRVELEYHRAQHHC